MSGHAIAADRRELVRLPTGKRVWMLPGLLRVSSGASGGASGAGRSMAAGHAMPAEQRLLALLGALLPGMTLPADDAIAAALGLGPGVVTRLFEQLDADGEIAQLVVATRSGSSERVVRIAATGAVRRSAGASSDAHP